MQIVTCKKPGLLYRGALVQESVLAWMVVNRFPCLGNLLKLSVYFLDSFPCLAEILGAWKDTTYYYLDFFVM